MLTRTESVVLKTQRYGEADLIVTYLTLNKGIIKAFVKSPLKTKSRFGSSMEPLTHAKISLWGKEQSMPKITQSDIINSFYQLRENLHDFVNASKLVEILLSLTPEGIPNKRLFLFFLNIMNHASSFGQTSVSQKDTKHNEKNPPSHRHNLPTSPFDKGGQRGILKMGMGEFFEHKQRNILYIIFQIRLLVLLGYAPRLGGCGRCGGKSLDFYPASGTVLCKRCAITPVTGREIPVRLTEKVVKFYSHCIKWPIDISTRLKPHREVVSMLSSVLDEHLNHLLGRKLLSSEFLARV